MSYLRALWISEASAAVVLIACALVLALVFGVPTNSGRMWFGYTLAVGVLPALAFGAPLYALLLIRNRNHLGLAVLLGIVPGIGIALLEPSLGLTAVGAGIAVAIGTHCLIALFRK